MNKGICEHLEAELPGVDDGELPYNTRYYITKMQETLQAPAFDERSAIKALESMGLNDYQIEILLDHCVSDWHYTEIAKNHGFIDRKTVSKFLKSTLEYLRLNSDSVKQKLGSRHE